jgi:hypothetical protein
MRRSISLSSQFERTFAPMSLVRVKAPVRGERGHVPSCDVTGGSKRLAKRAFHSAVDAMGRAAQVWRPRRC